MKNKGKGAPNRADTRPEAKHPGAERNLRIDAHHHLWRYTPQEFDWLEGDLAGLRRDYLPNDLLREMESAGVTGAVVVQARQTVDETSWLLDTAAANPEILGVVGWLPIAATDFESVLERFAGKRNLKGLRHVVQAEPEGFLDGDGFNHGMAHLAGRDLAYDLLIHKGQMEEAIRFVDRHPAQALVLDHMAKPSIASGTIEPWARNLRELARRPHVTCKISGMVTEASAAWTVDDLTPYLDVVLDAFTPARLMIGTDWPVLTPRCSYSQWWQTVMDWAAHLSIDEQRDLQGGTAARVYDLKPD
ncbi:MAG: amidohydrolase family protein [Janthinobacterium lividum]